MRGQDIPAGSRKGRAACVCQAEKCLGGRSGPPGMKPATRESGAGKSVNGRIAAGDQEDSAAGGAEAPAQQAAHALQ